MGEIKMQATQPKKVVGGGANQNTKAAAERVKVRFHNQEGVIGGTDDIVAGVNGKMYQIQREQDVSLPRFVLETIKNAAITTFEKIDGKDVQRDIQRFPYSLV